SGKTERGNKHPAACRASRVAQAVCARSAQSRGPSRRRAGNSRRSSFPPPCRRVSFRVREFRGLRGSWLFDCGGGFESVNISVLGTDDDEAATDGGRSGERRA